MKQRLPRSLGPKAKRFILKEAPDAVASCMVEFAPNAERNAVDTKLKQLNGKIRSWDASSRIMTVEIPAAKLPELANLDLIVYVELAARYMR